MTKTLEYSKEVTKDSLEEMRNRIKRLAELQGIPVTDAISIASNDELMEIEKLADKVKQLSDNSKALLESLKSLKSPLVKDISLNNIIETAEIAKGSINLFDEYIINAAKKSYDSLKKIKENKESTNFDFFKGCIRCAVDMFFAIKTFCKKVKEKYPLIIAAELTFATSLAPVYSAIGFISTALSACGFKDKTAELVVGGKELRMEVNKAKELKKSIENEHYGVSLETFSDSCQKLTAISVFDNVIKLAQGAKTIVDIAANLDKSPDPVKIHGVNFLKKMAEVVSDLPKSKAEISTFVEKMIPDTEKLPAIQISIVANLREKLEEIKDGTSIPERIASTALVLQKFSENFKRSGGEIPKPFNDLVHKLGEAVGAKGAERIAQAIGCGKAVALAVTNLAKSVNPALQQLSY